MIMIFSMIQMNCIRLCLDLSTVLSSGDIPMKSSTPIIIIRDIDKPRTDNENLSTFENNITKYSLSRSVATLIKGFRPIRTGNILPSAEHRSILK